MGSPIAAGILAAANPKYRFAAYAYLIYGVIYMTGAAHLGLTGASSRASMSNSWLWYTIGAAFMIVFPLLINRGFKWFCRALVALMAYRIYGLIAIMTGPTAAELVALPLLGEVSKFAGAVLFAIVTAATAGVLTRAAWDL